MRVRSAAALHHFHGVAKHRLTEKMFGVFAQQVEVHCAGLLRGFGPWFDTPVSRYTEVRELDLPTNHGLRVLAKSVESGLCLVDEPDRQATYLFNQIEYDTDTLAHEYRRALEAGMEMRRPKHYFPDDDARRAPENRWRTHAELLFRNWLREIELSQAADRAITEVRVRAG